ncbi:MAG: hypothetical protein IJZ07_04965 [Clostridia bacterium]|nr:hypothetical protein [Clostridia bacterium]MBQ9849158.1 hypothetical protein [Clostridia bacterium]MBR2868198.1 hypothetical protein [Clostridia bacterium]
MKEKIIEVMLKTTGLFLFVIGLFVSLIVGLDYSDYMYFIIGTLVCFLVGLFLVATGEIISLLRKNIERQNKIIETLNQKE